MTKFKWIARSHRIRMGTALALAVASQGVMPAARATQDYSIYTVGLYDSTASPGSHTGANGTNNSINSFSAAGGISGSATRYTSSIDTTTLGNNVWFYDPATHLTSVIGLVAPYSATATSNTESDGLQVSLTQFSNANNQFAGRSAFYSSAPSSGGGSFVANGGWFFSPGTGTVQIGFYDVQPSGTIGHMSTDGSFSTTVAGMNASGQVIGVSSRYDGTNSEGQDAWIYTGGKTIKIGPFGTDYFSTGDSEFQSVQAKMINDAGQVAGFAQNYTSGQQVAWFYDTTSTAPSAFVIGLTGGSYTSSQLSAINNTAVAGYTGLGSGRTAWIHNIALNNDVAVGINASVTPPSAQGQLTYSYNGTQSSTISVINASGQAIGSQQLYLTAASGAGGSTAGSDAFFYNGISTVGVGLTDAAHTAIPPTSFVFHGTNYTARTNSAQYLNDAGQVSGTARRYTSTASASTDVGQNAWFYSASTGTVLIGLTGSTYTNSTNTGQNSFVTAMNASGLVVGISSRYTSTGASAGSDAYLYTPGGSSVAIGLLDSGHISSDGVNKGTTSLLTVTDAGLVAGISTRFNGTSTNGQDAWVLNTTTSTLYPIVLSVTSTGYAFSTAQSLSAGGLLIGTYNKYGAGDALVGTFAYAYKNGVAYDLGINTTNLTAAGWLQLTSTLGSDLSGDVDGTGMLGSTSTYYVLAAKADWNGGTGNWSSAASWSTTVTPNSPGVEVEIDHGNATASVVTLNQIATIQNLAVDVGDKLIIAAGSGLTINGSGISTISGTLTNSGSLTVTSNGALAIVSGGALTSTGTFSYAGNFNNAGTATIAGIQSWSAGSTLTNTAGTADLQTDAGTTASRNLSLAVNGGVVKLEGSQHLQAVSLTGGILHVNGDAFLKSGSYATLAASIRSGAITTDSSKAGAAVALLTGAEFLQFNPSGQRHGQTVQASDLILSLTYAGDATLDGVISIDDYLQVDAGFSHPAGTIDWARGDFNYDGSINYLDYALIDHAFQVQSGSLADSEIALHASEFGPTFVAALDALNTSAVPEPASLSILAGASGMLLLRRGRRLNPKINPELAKTGK